MKPTDYTPTQARQIIAQAQNTWANGYAWTANDKEKLSNLLDQLIRLHMKLEVTK